MRYFRDIVVAALIATAVICGAQSLERARADVGAVIDRTMVERAVRALEASAAANEKAARAAEKAAERCR
jgi:hypothetical protein